MVEEVNKRATKDSVVIGYEELQDKVKCKKYLVHGKINELNEISHNIFKLLREVDKHNPDLIIIMGVKKEGLGIAIMNRLIRSASYNYIGD